MKLSEKFLAFCKSHIDKWMLSFQRDGSVDLAAWKELQTEYKKLYGKDYERKN